MSHLTDEIAAALNGTEYGNDFPADVVARAKANRIVIAYGHSDDLLELDGFDRDEVDAYDGTTVAFNSAGMIKPECDDDDCPHEKRRFDAGAKLELAWNDGGDPCAWTFETKIPHSKFDILEDGELFCIGVVFSLDDLGQEAA